MEGEFLLPLYLYRFIRLDFVTINLVVIFDYTIIILGVKRTTQIPIEIGYKIARRFASKSPDAKKNAEMLGLMVNDPNIAPNELSKITAPTLVICGKSDMIKESHTKEIAENIPNAKLSIIKGNHFIANKRYVTFNKEVEDFLQTIR